MYIGGCHYHGEDLCDLMSRLGVKTHSWMSKQEEVDMATRTGLLQMGKHVPSTVSRVASELWMR